MKSKILAALTAWCLLVAGLVVAPSATAAPADSDTGQDQERVLFEDSFSSEDGAQWDVHKSTDAVAVTFTDGVATIKGGGPENRIMTKAELLAANFVFALDLIINEGNTNSAIKLGFLASSAADRYQLTYDGPKAVLKLERVENATATVLTQKTAVNLQKGQPHAVRITVDGDKISASVDDDILLEATDPSISGIQQGHILVASQFPNQDFSVDNVRVTTTDLEKVGEYTVDLETKTNGVADSEPAKAGGTLTANRATGDHGDVVSLTPTAKPGFVFDGYESFLKENGASTDGLLDIINDRFAFDDKTGSVIIVAKFSTEPADPNQIFADSFDQEFNNHGLYEVNDAAALEVVDEELIISPGAGPAYALVDASSWPEMADYRLALSLRKANSTAGTVQIGFRGSSFADRYVLALNGDMALLRRFDSAGNNIELARANYIFNETSRNILIDVSGETVSVSSDGKPVISYTNMDDPGKDASNWSGLKPGLSLINMTPSAPVAFDNIVVKRVPSKVGLEVQVLKDGIQDDQNASGAVVLSAYSAQGGGVVDWNAYPKGGYRFAGMKMAGEEVTGNQFVIPHGVTGTLVLEANFVPEEVTPTTFYVDSVAGNDSNPGTEPSLAWKTLENLDRTFNPGDQIRLKRGSKFQGQQAQFVFDGSGTSAQPIVVGAYGEGERPQLNGGGEIENVISLFNQEHIMISGLEITNLDQKFDQSFGLNKSNNREKNLRAVNVSAQDFGVVHNITISDLYIHSVNGNINAKWNGGIFFDVKAARENGQLQGTPTKYDGVLLEGNRLENVDRSGIKLVSSAWANQSAANDPTTPLNWYPSTNVVVRDNQLRYMGGDSITVRDTDGALIEHNLARHSRYQNTGYNAGIWPFQTTNTVIQYNEVSHTHGVQDGQGLDTDHVSSYSVMQYNYSHDNEGGFMLIMNGFPHTAPTIRYNLSQNDADKTFEFARGTAAGTMIYNNTIYSDTLLQGPRGGVLDLANSGAGTGNREVFLFNNIFHYPQGQRFYVGEAATMEAKAQLFNNAYSGGIDVPKTEEQAVLGDLDLPGLGTAPTDNGTASKPLTGQNVSTHFDGYIPGEDSVLRNAGVSVADVVARYEGTTTDRRDLSPTAIHALALKGQSIDFVAGEFMPSIEGVSYGTDFLGRELPNLKSGARADSSAEGITIGAIQFQAEDEEQPSVPGEGGDEELPPTPGPGEGEGEEGGDEPGDTDKPGGGEVPGDSGTSGGADQPGDGEVPGDSGTSGGADQPGSGEGDNESNKGPSEADSDKEMPKTGASMMGALVILAGLLLAAGIVTRRFSVRA